MKKLVAFLALVAVSLAITAYVARDFISAEILPAFRGIYRGEDIVSIEYSSSVSGKHLMDFESGKYYAESYADFPGEEYRLVCDLDPTVKRDFLNAIYKHGFFDIEEEYNTGGICGGWSLWVRFADGRYLRSWGTNVSPENIFKKFDEITNKYYGIAFMKHGAEQVGDAPSIRCEITPEGSQESYTKLMKPVNYSWHQRTLSGVDSIEYALCGGTYVFTEGTRYSVRILADGEREIEVASCLPDGSDARDVTVTDGVILVDTGRVYLINISYDGGTCEYALSTCADDLSVAPDDLEIYIEGLGFRYDSRNDSAVQMRLPDQYRAQIYRILRESGVADLGKRRQDAGQGGAGSLSLAVSYGSVNYQLYVGGVMPGDDTSTYPEGGEIVDTALAVMDVVNSAPKGYYTESAIVIDGYAYFCADIYGIGKVGKFVLIGGEDYITGRIVITNGQGFECIGSIDELTFDSDTVDSKLYVALELKAGAGELSEIVENMQLFFVVETE